MRIAKNGDEKTPNISVLSLFVLPRLRATKSLDIFDHPHAIVLDNVFSMSAMRTYLYVRKRNTRTAYFISYLIINASFKDISLLVFASNYPDFCSAARILDHRVMQHQCDVEFIVCGLLTTCTLTLNALTRAYLIFNVSC